MTNRVFALILCFVMCLSLFPASSFAEGEVAEEPVPSQEEELSAGFEEATDENTEAEEVPTEESYTEETAEEIPAEAVEGPEDESATLHIEEEFREEEEILFTAQDDLDDPFVAVEADKPQSIIDSGTCGPNATWKLSDDGTLTIQGYGDMTNFTTYLPNLCPWANKVSDIKKVIISEDINSVGDLAFLNCSNLTSVSLPNSLKYIGWSSFGGCGLTNIELPEGVTSIGKQAFGYCALTRIGLPASVTNINDQAFIGCDSLQHVFYGGSEAQKNEMAGTGWSTEGNASLFDASWHFGSTTPSVIASGDCGAQGNNLTWTLDDSGVLTIRGTGDMKDYNLDLYGVLDTPWSLVRQNIITVTINDGVTHIGKYAFCACDSMTTVSIPESVTSIGNNAFQLCYSLNDVVLPTGLVYLRKSTFGQCKSLTNISIPEGVTHIEDHAFTSSGLSEIWIPNSVWFIGENAFYECKSLSNIMIPSSVTYIGERCFHGCSNLKTVTFSGDMPTLFEYSFYNVIATVNYPASNQTYTADNMLNYGGTLTWVPHGDDSGTIASGICGDNLTWKVDDQGALTISGTGNMYNYYFRNMPPWQAYSQSITRLVVEDGVSSIGNYACYQYSNLKEAHFPNTLTLIGETAFEDCVSLTEVIIPQNVSNISKVAFARCTGLQHVVILSDNATYDFNVFNGCTSLKTAGPIGSDANIEYCWTDSIPDNVFYQLSSLVDISIPAGISAIGKNSFLGCTGLTEIVFPETIKSIQASSFADCNSLRKVTLSGNMPVIGENAFYEVVSEVYYPKGNATYDPAKMLGYGGTLTWIGNCSHNAGEAVRENVIAATCTQAGSYDEVVYCTVCGEELNRETKTIPATGHTSGSTVRENEVAVTCTESGSYDEVVYCSVCGVELSRNTVTIPALGHQFELVGWLWNDYEEATVTFICKNDPSHVEKVSATITSERTEPTVGKQGSVVYTAAAEFEGQTYTDAKTEVLPALKPGWQEIDGKWYYFNADGTPKTGWLKSGSSWFYLDPSTGAMATGWVKVGGTWYYMKDSGAMATGWQKVGSTWYYFESSGAMKTGWLKSGSTWYYLKSSGAMAVGWQKVGSTWYYFQSSGAMKTGWLKDGGKWYYLDSSGAMLASTSRNIGGKVYYFNASGVCTNP